MNEPVAAPPPACTCGHPRDVHTWNGGPGYRLCDCERWRRDGCNCPSCTAP